MNKESIKQWKRKNMNIMAIYESWGIAGNNDLMIQISLRHRDHKTALQKFDMYLRKAYSPKEIPVIINKYSHILAGSMLQFLRDIDGGAESLVELIEIEAAN